MPDATVTNGTARILWVQSPTNLVKFPPLVTVTVLPADVEPVGYALLGAFAPFVADGSVTYSLPSFEDHRSDPPPPDVCPPTLALPSVPATPSTLPTLPQTDQPPTDPPPSASGRTPRGTTR